MLCDGATRGGYQTRKCQGNTGSGCTGISQQMCNTQACINCTTTPWSYPSQCSNQCGGGWQSITRQVIQQPDVTHGGTPCPILELDMRCNTQFCQQFLAGRGYLSWGPIWGGDPGQPPVVISYNIYSNPDNVDVFLFTADNNYLLYIQDTYRTPAWNTGYTAYRSMLNTDNCFETVTLQAGTNYYLVVDNTPVGAANGNNGQYDPLTIGYNVTGVDLTQLPPPINTGDAFRTSASVLVVFSAVAAALLALAL